MSTIILQNDTLRLTFDRATGALIGLTAVQTGWEILSRPHLGLSFRLLVPLTSDDPADVAFAARMGRAYGERRNNPVFGEKQTLTALELAPDGKTATFTWDGITSEVGGPLAIKVVLTVTLSERQAIFAMTVENRSRHVIENVYCPYLGDVQHPADAAWFKTFSYSYATAQEWPLWPTYNNMRGYFGVDYPTQIASWGPASGAPMSPFILLRGEKQGLYAGITTPSPELVAWGTELRPGYGSSIDHRVPESQSVSGKDVATRFAAIHVPYIQPGETRTLTPIALEAYQGGWQHGTDIYKAWRDTWMKHAPQPAWARAPHAWLQLHINSPEDELRIPFRELPAVAEQCARHGIRAIQLVGWNDGGQDQGNPSHDPDPRLGTFAELREAIGTCHALGVKIVLFAKFTWSDRATKRFREDLHRLAIKDPYGDYYLHQGYQYQTATQLLDINTKRLIPMCFLSEAYLRVCDEEFRKTVELGAAGILFDECLHHSPALLCFDPNHGHRAGAPVYANDRKLIQNFSRISQPANPDFLFAGEACYDWEMEAYHLSYHRSENKQHVPLSRYLLPDGLFMTAVTGFDDRNMVNQCLLYRYVISYEPYNFKGMPEDYPLTLSYGKQMDALRTELREYFWDGEFRHEVGATVLARSGDRPEQGQGAGGQGAEARPHHPYAVFISRKTGKAGVVVANYDERETVTVTIQDLTGLRDLSGLRYRLVDDPAWRSAADGIVLPPMSAAVVVGE
jgi:hypothetical protein